MRDPLIAILKDPTVAAKLSTAQWADLLPRLKYANLLAHFGERMAVSGVSVDVLPPAVQRQLAATQSSAWVQARTVRWECGELTRIFAGTGIPLILLKGAGYVMNNSLPGRGRFVDDLDLLVPHARLGEVSELLQLHGWVNQAIDEAEVEYYEEWLHQVPAFQHSVRSSMLDVHHTIIAPWGGHRVTTELLFEAAVPLGEGPLAVPSAFDQCLIVAAHFIRSDANTRAFRDLLDLDEILGRAAPDAPSREKLVERARAVGLERALSTATHFAAALFGTATIGPRPFAVGVRAKALIPIATRRRSTVTAVLREFHHVGALRAGLTWQVMVERTVKRRLKKA